MSERKGFILAPSKFGKPSADDQGSVSKPKFTGFKQSKLSVLAESKLASINPTATGASETEVPDKSATFSFAPLTKPAGGGNTTTTNTTSENTENVSLTANTDTNPTKGIQNTEEGKTSTFSTTTPAAVKKDFPVFGENLRDKVKNVGTENVQPVFGENLTEKAIVPDKETTAASDTTATDDKTQTQHNTPEKTETKDLGFSSVSGTPQVEAETKTLSESAAELTEQTNSNKRKYEQVAVVTGEEEESNVLKCNVKLYIFDGEKRNWTERGRGVLRLNDSPNSTPGHIFSRLVMRTHGSLRVVLNTKLWREMVCEKVNDKNIRISAWDENIIKIFLISCSQKDAETLHHALECRLNQLKQDSAVAATADNDEDKQKEQLTAASENSTEGSGIGEKSKGVEEETVSDHVVAVTGNDSADREENGEPKSKKLATAESSEN
eukprot:TRINITY_DN4863_c0_g1_i1.p1 TRINITY_DN4863_c0_g1~~TRINITY_DN4863_c0_g1_i1.p1  ORF type:complete len:438 (-),score=113.62 TRINITY_DN4863_c0_g1_i1:792-2105(-)